MKIKCMDKLDHSNIEQAHAATFGNFSTTFLLLVAHEAHAALANIPPAVKQSKRVPIDKNQIQIIEAVDE